MMIALVVLELPAFCAGCGGMLFRWLTANAFSMYRDRAIIQG